MSFTDNESPSDEPDATNAANALEGLPPSAKLVYKVLEYEGAMTQEELATESRLCQRTVRYALTKLESDDFVDSRISLEDARQSIYRLKTCDDGR